MSNYLLRLLFGLGASVLLLSCQDHSATSAPVTEPKAMPPAAEWVGQGARRLHLRAYYSAPRPARPVLVVVVHGDAPFRPPGYQYQLARQLAATYPGIVAVGLLRPGYSDPQGNRSAGRRGEATGDNYTPEVVDAVAAALGELRQRYHATRVVVVGHSGGAAITANLLARHPTRLDAALLASCPCDVPRWRQHMQQLQGGAIWEAPVRSLSPQALVGGVSTATPVTLVVGTADSVAPPRFSRAYWQALQQRHHPAQLVQLPDQGHEILLSAAVQREIGTLLTAR